MSEMDTFAALRGLESEYERLTGHQAYVYADSPSGVTRYHFTDASVTGAERAVRHMTGLLDLARSGVRPVGCSGPMCGCTFGEWQGPEAEG